MPASTFSDTFTTDYPERWIYFDGSHWPPVDGYPGWFSRMFYYGWPTNGEGQDLAARQNTDPKNDEAQVYEDDGLSFSDGGLVLTARRKPSRGKPWTSGMIAQTRERAQLYGRFMVEMTMPTVAKGFWPGFWLLPKSLRWPPEIDVMEAVAKTWDNQPNTYSIRSGVVGVDAATTWGTAKPGLNVFEVRWYEKTIQFFLNGEALADPTPNTVFEPMYMLVDLAVGGPNSWPGEPDPDVNESSITIRSITSYAS